MNGLEKHVLQRGGAMTPFWKATGLLHEEDSGPDWVEQWIDEVHDVAITGINWTLKHPVHDANEKLVPEFTWIAKNLEAARAAWLLGAGKAVLDLARGEVQRCT